MSKAIWQSKTIWVNVLSLLAVVLGAPEYVGISPATATAGLAIVNLVLRWLTSKPITVTGA